MAQLQLVAPPERSRDALVDVLLEPGALHAVVQPVVRLADGEVVGYEALSRATDPAMPGPDVWFEAARRRGGLVELEVACLTAIAELGPPPDDALLFVNISPTVVGDARTLALRDLLPSRLVLELTERDAIADIDAVRADLSRWTNRGARVALDDTGAGYAGLQQVVLLQPEFMKLDRQLVAGIDSHRPRQALVAALVAFAREVGASIIAEGIETTDELRWLQSAGVALGQGFWFARPSAPWPLAAAPPRSRRPDGGRASDLHDRLSGSHSRRAACDAVAEHLHRLGALMPSVYLEAGGRLRCQGQRGLWQVLDGMAPSAGITGRTYRTGRSHHVEDVHADPDYLEAIPGIVAEACTPIVVDGRPIGALNIESTVRLEPGTIAYLDECAAQLAERLVELPSEPGGAAVRRLAAVASSLVAVADPTETASAVVASACELAGTDSGAVLVGSVERGFELAVAAGPLERALGATEVDDVVQIARMLAPLTSCYSSGEATGRSFVGGDALREAGARAVIALPLLAGGRRTGMLLLAHTAPLGLGPDVIEPLEVLAMIAGACLDTARDLVELRTRASRDPLTGLRNHARFHEALREVPAERPLALAMFDVDGFKQVNDTLGHLRGDEVLREMTAVLRATAPDGARLFRVGGDEIAMAVGSDDLTTVGAAIEGMLHASQRVLAPFGASLSAGVAVRGGGEPALAALERADAALYRAKRGGGGLGLG